MKRRQKNQTNSFIFKYSTISIYYACVSFNYDNGIVLVVVCIIFIHLLFLFYGRLDVEVISLAFVKKEIKCPYGPFSCNLYYYSFSNVVFLVDFGHHFGESIRRLHRSHRALITVSDLILVKILGWLMVMVLATVHLLGFWEVVADWGVAVVILTPRTMTQLLLMMVRRPLLILLASFLELCSFHRGVLLCCVLWAEILLLLLLLTL